jgi:hypothetical protein
VLLWDVVDTTRSNNAEGSDVGAAGAANPVAGLAVCRYDAQPGVFLFECDHDWNSLTDSWHQTAQEAVREGERAHSGAAMTWIEGTPEDTLPLEFSRLSPASRNFAVRLFEAIPHAREHARMEGEASADLLVVIPSPTGLHERELLIWMCGGDEPSLAFGGWHTHAGCQESDDGIIELAKAILADTFGVAFDLGRVNAWGQGLDLRVPDELLEELTSPGSSGRLKIITWSGLGDREVSVRELR